MQDLTLETAPTSSLCEEYFERHKTESCQTSPIQGKKTLDSTINTPQEYRRYLLLTRLIYSITLEALQKFQARDYEANDALVSECQCHLRAIRNLEIAESFLGNPDMRQSLEKTSRLLHEKISLIDTKIAEIEKIPITKRIALREFLGEVDVRIQGWMLHLSQTYFLTLSKEFETESERLAKKKELSPEDTLPACADCSAPIDPLHEVTGTHAFQERSNRSRHLLALRSLAAKQLTKEQRAELALAAKTLTAEELQESITVALQSKFSPERLKAQIETLEEKLTLAPKTLAELTKQVKVFISESSVHNIIAKAKRLDSMTRSMLCMENTRRIADRLELPCAYSLTGSLQIALQAGAPCLLKVQRAEHYVEDNPPRYDVIQLYVARADHYERADLSAIESDRPLIVLEGRRAGLREYREPTSMYLERLNRYTLERLIELNAVQHDQFSIAALSSIDAIPLLQDSRGEEEKRRLLVLIREADMAGCSFKNQSLFLLTHMFLGTVAKHGHLTGGAGDAA